jgi:FkbM family methyltransferase
MSSQNQRGFLANSVGINFSALPASRWFGRVARWPLSGLPRSAVVPVLQGALRGKKWVVGASTHGCWLGSYEYPQRRMFEKHVGSGDVVYDIGANVGFYALLASCLVEAHGHVVAFEPHPRNLAYLYRHLAINRVTNVTVKEGAVWESDGALSILDVPASSEVKVDPSGTIRVPCFALDTEVFLNGLPSPTVLKIDVEGAEAEVLRGAMKTLIEKRPRLFLSTHGESLHTACCDLLSGTGYRLRPINAKHLESASEIFAEV